MAERALGNIANAAWRNPFLRTGVAAVTFIGTPALITACEPSSAATIQSTNSCDVLPSFNSTAPVTTAEQKAAQVCFRFQRGLNGKRIVVVTAGSLTAAQRSDVAGIMRSDVAVNFGIKPAIEVRSATTQEKEIIQQNGPVNCNTPADQTPANALAQQLPPNAMLEVDLAQQPGECYGGTIPNSRASEIFTGNKNADTLSIFGAKIAERIAARNTHEMGHLFGLGHEGRFILNTQKPVSFEEFVNQAHYQEYGLGDVYNNNIMGFPSLLYSFNINPIQKAELNEPAVIMHKAKSEAKKLGSDWLAINARAASQGRFAYMHLDNPITKVGRWKENIAFDTLAAIPLTDANGKINAVEIAVFDSIKSHNIAIIGNPILLDSNLWMIRYKGQVIQFKIDSRSNALLTRVLPETSDNIKGLQAFMKPIPTPTYKSDPAAIHSVH